MLGRPRLDPVEILCHRIAVVIESDECVRIGRDIRSVCLAHLLDVSLHLGKYGKVESAPVVTHDVVTVLEGVVYVVHMELVHSTIGGGFYADTGEFLMSFRVILDGTEAEKLPICFDIEE
jgi:hypothetical protein